MCANDYDDDMQVEYSSDVIDLDMSVPKRIEPGVLEVFDACLPGNVPAAEKTELVILCCRGEDFFYDVLSPKIAFENFNKEGVQRSTRLQSLTASAEYSRRRSARAAGLNGVPADSQRASLRNGPHQDSAAGIEAGGEALLGTKGKRASQPLGEELPSCLIKSIRFNPFRGYWALWPYVSFSGFDDYLWLFSAFDPEYIKMIKLPGTAEDRQVVETLITKEKYLYIVLYAYSLESY